MAPRPAEVRDALRIALRDLDRLAAELPAATATVSGAPTTLELYGAGALAHGYYTHLERALERIAGDLSGERFDGSDWHRRLLQSMTLDRPGFRPAVLPLPLSERLDELLRFRHLFRNLYVLNLDPRRIRDILALAQELHPEVRLALEAFDRFLAAMP